MRIATFGCPMAVGELLRGAREHRGLTLEQVAADTKIPLDRLAAFEQDRLPPHGFYERAQIRAFAHAVHLDYRVILDQLNPPAPSEPAVALPEEPALKPTRMHRLRAAMATVCALAVVATGVVVMMNILSRPETIAEAATVPLETIQPEISPTRGTLDGPATVAPAWVTPSDVAVPAAEAMTPLVETAPAVEAARVVTQLVITSKPEGARVTVDGIGWGVTPLTIRHLDAGPKRMRVTSDGYASAEQVVEVGSGRAATVSIQLRALAPSIQPEF